MTGAMSMQTIEAGLKALKEAYKRQKNPEKWGLGGWCLVIRHNTVEYSKGLTLFKHYTEKWPQYTGIPMYPVPGPNGRYPVSAFEGPSKDEKFECEEYRMWDREQSEYAELRWQLMEFVITQAEIDIELATKRPV